MSTGILYSSAVLSLSKQSFGSFSNAGSTMSSLHNFYSEGLISPQDPNVFARTEKLMIAYSIAYFCLLQGLQMQDSLQLLQLLNMPGRVTRNMLGGMTI